ncbi:nuclear transport factor 2 family protein [Actinocorallia longicatena]|uniref:SnoaL-like domain-containing protein n=1 Tax=Actinocorallia longicatena TaxID=111803 RepID=A0ABP6PXR5_9ACTN
MSEWAPIHERVVAAFAEAWREPGPEVWQDLFTERVELVQPLLGGARGRPQAVAEVRRLLAFLPDATGEVLDWAGAEDVMFIDLRITGTVGGKPLSFRTLDKLRIDRTARIVRRDAFFDSVPLMLTLACRPSAWLPWWRSGIGPLASRRRLLRN